MVKMLEDTCLSLNMRCQQWLNEGKEQGKGGSMELKWILFGSSFNEEERRKMFL